MTRRLTPPGESALAVVAVTGDDAVERLRGRVRGPLPRPGRLRVVQLELAGFQERAVIAAVEGGYEVSVHGNPVLVDALLAAVGGGRDAGEAGLEHEIVRSATHAASRTGVRWCLWQRGERGLFGLVAAIADGRGHGLRERVRTALDNGEWLRRHLEPPLLVLRGRTNAGKSTLFNLLVGRERVRTGPQVRLTRDPVDEVVLLGGTPFRLVDTAGEVEAASGLDAEAVARARSAERRAEFTVWVCALTEPAPPDSLANSAIRVWTHADRADPRDGEPAFCLVAAEPSASVETRAAILAFLTARLAPATTEPEPGPAWLNEPQRAWLNEVHDVLASGGDPSRLARRMRRRV